MSKRQYSDNDKANALAALKANAGNVLKTARDLGIPEANLRNWSKGVDCNGEVAEICEGKKECLAERLEGVANQILDGMPAMIGKAKLSEAGITLGILVEKIQLLKGHPTGINLNLAEEQKRAKVESMKLEMAKAS